MTVSIDVLTLMSVSGRVMSDGLKKEIRYLLEEGVSTLQGDVCFMSSL